MNNQAALQGKETRKKIVKFLVDYMGTNGYSPSFKEIARAVGLSSTNAVYNALNQLEKEGVIKRSPIARSIVILDTSRYLEPQEESYG